jgi:sugar phosphate isomerase/epimerase
LRPQERYTSPQAAKTVTHPPIGVVDVTYAACGDEIERSRRARDDGFAHIDVVLGTDPVTLALPIGCPTAFPKPADTWCATPVPPDWDRAVRWWRAAPRALLEPHRYGAVNSTEAVRAFLEEVPGVRLLVDTGHVADWGGDPCELLDLADHVQLRQGAPSAAQLHLDDPRGVVDFGAVFARLDARGYRGKCSVEYFDLPEHGWALDDPRAWACDLLVRLTGPDR